MSQMLGAAAAGAGATFGALVGTSAALAKPVERTTAAVAARMFFMEAPCPEVVLEPITVINELIGYCSVARRQGESLISCRLFGRTRRWKFDCFPLLQISHK